MRIKKIQSNKLSLANSGALELFFFGVGSAFTKRQSQTNLLIIKGKDHLLVDCGTRLPPLITQLGLKVTDIRNILITHSHADHIGGLEEIALTGKYAARKKPVMIINSTYQRILWDMSLRGGCGYNEWDTSLRGGTDYNENETLAKLSFKDFFDVLQPRLLPGFPRETFEARVGRIKIKLMRTKHIPDASPDWKSSFWSCGIIINDRVMFTSDTRYDPDLINFYEKKFRLETIFHDCQFTTGGIHAGIEELNQLPKSIKKKMFLTHYGDDWEDFLEKVSSYGFAGLAKQQVRYIFD